MKIKEKIMLDRDGLKQHGPINVVVFGDSVSHGAVNGYFDYENVYWNLLKQKLHAFRDYMPINFINTSIAGTTASESLPRLENQVIIHKPDLVIVCFGLNDVNGSLENYLNSLKAIFTRLKEENIDVIFMTPNMLNTSVAEDTPPSILDYAKVTAQMQTQGRMDEYINSAKKLAEDMDITVCDCYSKWKELSKTNDITMLLANRINHPTSEMHNLFADSLYEIIIGEEKDQKPSDSTMYNGK